MGQGVPSQDSLSVSHDLRIHQLLLGKTGKEFDRGRKAGVEAETGRKWPGSWVISSPLQNEVLRS